MDAKIEIRKLEPSMAKDTWKYREDKYVWVFTPCDTPRPASFESERKAYEAMTLSSDDHFAMMYNGTMVGMVKLKNCKCGTCEISYYILRTDLWRTGIAKRCVSDAIDYAFREKGLDMVYVYVNPRNVPSFAMALSLNFFSVGVSLLDNDVQRLEMPRTVWKKKKSKKNV